MRKGTRRACVVVAGFLAVVAVGCGPSVAGGPDGAWRAFLDCVGAHESDSAGGYSAVNPNGHYGRYQFDQPTWDSNAPAAGHPDYVGVRPDQAPPGVQDDVAIATAQARGGQPWAGSGCTPP